jgi:hypothetical protein
MSYEQPIRTIFFFLRTKRGIQSAEAGIDAVREGFPFPAAQTNVFADGNSIADPASMLLLGKNRVTWEDGFVIRLQTYRPVIDIGNSMQGALDQFDAWAVHNGCGDFKESFSGGLISRFFENLWDGEYSILAKLNRPHRAPISQLFLMRREDDRRYQDTVDQIRSSMGEDCLSLPVFHFRNGHVLFLNSSEPGNITIRRCGGHLSRLESWAILDSGGHSFTKTGEDGTIWRNFGRGVSCPKKTKPYAATGAPTGWPLRTGAASDAGVAEVDRVMQHGSRSIDRAQARH